MTYLQSEVFGFPILISGRGKVHEDLKIYNSGSEFLKIQTPNTPAYGIFLN